jgi:hypothetical protein
METNDLDLSAQQNAPCPYCGSTADHTPQGEQVRCSECGNSFTPTGEIVHASMPARTEAAPARAVSPAAATGLHCPECFAPAGQLHSAGCNEAGLASAVRKAIDMLAGVVAAAPNGRLALPAVLGILRSGLEASESDPMAATDDWLQYDFITDTLTIHGIKYAHGLFLDFAKTMPEGQPFQIVSRTDGALCVQRIEGAAS